MVTETVVDRLKLVNVDHKHRHRPLIALIAAPFDFGHPQEMSPIEETGHAVELHPGGHRLFGDGPEAPASRASL
jgi:hypothetical protein